MDNRYYFEKVIDNTAELDKTETGHLVKVRRAKVGDIITGFCGDGLDYKLQIEEIGKTTSCKVIDKQPNKAVNISPVTVFLATTKNDALNETIDNLTQLNVKNIIVFDSEYSVANIDSDKIEKLKLKSIQACKQSERADCVNISLMKYKQMLEKFKDFDLVLFA